MKKIFPTNAGKHAPARVIESSAVRDLSREVQDLITLGIWSVGLFGGLWVLWWAHRESRI